MNPTDEEIQNAKEYYEQVEKQCRISDNMYHTSNSAKNRLDELEYIRHCYNEALEVEMYSPGTLLILGKYVVTVNNKWRIKGKNTWYRYGDFYEFVYKKIICNEWRPVQQ